MITSGCDFIQFSEGQKHLKNLGKLMASCMYLLDYIPGTLGFYNVFEALGGRNVWRNVIFLA